MRRQSCASVAMVRTTGSLPMSPVPLSVSSVQIAMSSSFGTPNCCSMRASSAACFSISVLARLMRAGITRVRAYSSKLLAGTCRAGGGRRRARSGRCVTPAKAWSMTARETPARLRLARHAGEEGVEIAAAFGGRGGRGERDHDKERRNQSEHGWTLVAPAWSYTVTLSLSFFLVIAGLVPAIHDESQQQESVQLRKRHLIMDARVKPGHDVERLLTHSPAR